MKTLSLASHFTQNKLTKCLQGILDTIRTLLSMVVLNSRDLYGFQKIYALKNNLLNITMRKINWYNINNAFCLPACQQGST